MTGFRKRIGDIIETDVDDETVIVQLESGDMYSLAGTGRAVWKLLDAESDSARVGDILAERYGASPRDVAGDVASFLGEMSAAGLVEPAP